MYFCVTQIHNSSSFSSMRKKRKKIIGLSHARRVADILRIYDEHCHSGLSNREILRQFIYPVYPICEKTFYNIINASVRPDVVEKINEMQLTLF